MVRIEAPDVTLESFELRHSSRLLEHEHAGVTVTAPRATVRNNVLHAVLRDPDISLHPGEAVALWGGNGAGKTTALRCILSLIRHEASVVLDGFTSRRDAREVRRRISYVPQQQRFPELSTRELLELFARLRGAGSDEAAELAALAVFRRTNVV